MELDHGYLFSYLRCWWDVSESIVPYHFSSVSDICIIKEFTRSATLYSSVQAGEGFADMRIFPLFYAIQKAHSIQVIMILETAHDQPIL